MLAAILLTIGIGARLITHEPNFTPTLALVLFGGVYLTRRLAIIVPLALMMITDIFLGPHNIMFFTWGSLVLIAYIGIRLRKQKNAVTVFGASLLSAIAFFVISNFGVWALGWYPHTMQGLLQCYVAAIPFFRQTAVSTLVYSAVFFGIYEAVAYRVKDTRFARALLTT